MFQVFVCSRERDVSERGSRWILLMTEVSACTSSLILVAQSISRPLGGSWNRAYVPRHVRGLTILRVRSFIAFNILFGCGLNCLFLTLEKNIFRIL